MKYELAIFDMDGTILNTLDDIAASLNYALTKGGYPTRTLGEVRSFVGNGIRRLVELGLPADADAAEKETAVRAFMEHYSVHSADMTRPYDGIPELLRELRRAGVRTAVSSNKADAAVKELCGVYFSGLFDAAAGDREGMARKPAPDSVNGILRLTGVAREKTVYIGDSEVDVRTAINAGVELIAVDWGFRSREELTASGADRIASTPGEVLAFIL